MDDGRMVGGRHLGHEVSGAERQKTVTFFCEKNSVRTLSVGFPPVHVNVSTYVRPPEASSDP